MSRYFVKKIISVFIFSILLGSASLFATIADDAKKAIKEYAGYDELVERGFTLNKLDKITTPEDLYKVLLPYMIVDGKPLDNLLSFNDYNFQCHKSIKFENVYGTFDNLVKKGYKPEQLFYYPSKGEGIYRVGNFVWEKSKKVPTIWSDICFYNRPFMGKNIAYFFVGMFTDNYFDSYIKEISKKAAIVIDLRLNQGGWGNQIYKLGEALCKANYKGKIIFVIDRTTGSDCENAMYYNLKDSYYINGSNKNVGFEWVTVGENTQGVQIYASNVKWNYQVGELKFSPLPVKTNEWKFCEEGVGFMPSIWASGEEDINKTIEFLTGEKNFAELIKDVTQWRNYICSSETSLWNLDYRLPDPVKKIKSDTEYNKTVAAIMDSMIPYYSLLTENRQILKNMNWKFDDPVCAANTKNVQEYTNALETVIDAKKRWVSFLVENNESLKQIYYYEIHPDCFIKCPSYKTYSKYFSEWIDLRIARCKTLMRKELDNIGYNFKTPDCAQKVNDIREFFTAYKKENEAKTKWMTFIIENRDNLTKINYYFEYPQVFEKCPSYTTYVDCFSKWIDKRIEWCAFSLKDVDGMCNNPTWWAEPEFFKSFKAAEEYTDYFGRWMDLRLWWCNFILEYREVFQHNSIPVWYEKLKTEIKEWKNPEKHLTELTSYLKGLVPWIEFLNPHPYVIPKDMEMAKIYSDTRSVSSKIGKNCSSVPADITKLQKTDPVKYMDKMVAYINSVAENDFEKVKLVFDIEQEILTYDNDDYRRMLEKINTAKKGVGEDYEQYSEKLNELWKNETEERPGQDWQSVLKNGKCVCEGYAVLMQYFCYKLGIKCDMVYTAKDMIFSVGHAWNIVQLEGEDYILDATWGYNYLFMDPKFSVECGHFPREPKQQLLKKPMTLDEYKKLKNYKGNK